VIDALVLLGTAAALAALARSGRRHSEMLVPGAYSADDRRHRIAVVRRGAAGCYLAAGVVLFLAVLALF
jgi:hypothetical protein